MFDNGSAGLKAKNIRKKQLQGKSCAYFSFLDFLRRGKICICMACGVLFSFYRNDSVVGKKSRDTFIIKSYTNSRTKYFAQHIRPGLGRDEIDIRTTLRIIAIGTNFYRHFCKR